MATSAPSKGSRNELAANLVASTATGMIVITLTNPIDCLKCRWQVAGGSRPGHTLGGFVRTLVVQEGIWSGLWKVGLGPNILAMGCSVGLRNGFYPTIRDGMGRLRDSFSGAPLRSGEATEKVGPTGMFVSGLLAGMCGYFIASPLMQVKTQMQAEAGKLGPDGCYQSGARQGQPPSYRNSFQALSSLAASGAAEGGVLGALRILWRGASLIVGRGAVLSASQLAAYDGSKTSLRAQGVLSDGPVLHVTASLIAAVVCTTCAMPLDVVQTMYHSSHSLGGESYERYGQRGPIGCAATLLRESGPTIFFRGWVPAFGRLAPTTVMSFYIYEQLRHVVGIGYLD
ncbi:unnamed protein product [Polarella glacialis]|uniref:Mitochondrial carrier protein n=2 Tax=Polarella glacialis TaxID=89957 RepID=A0A813G6V0_POLGL|nr:unnamed protein product [Polarella glacialis]